MAFKGDLSNITLFDVFQTLNTNRQSGVLVLRRDAVMKKIYFSPEGVQIFFTRSARPLRLGEIFVRRGRVTRQDIEILLMQQKQEYRPIGELLVESGKVSKEELQQTLRYHAEDEIYEVFGWDRGSFAFFDRDMDGGDSSNSPLSEVVLDAGGLCLEAARRLDEIERLREIVPEDREFYIRRNGAAIDLDAVSVDVAALFDALIEPGSVDGLRDVVSATLYQVLKCLVELCKLDVVRILENSELVETAREARAAGRYEHAARLLERAHEREPQDAIVLQECVGVLERLEDPERLAQRLAQLATILATTGEHEKALEPLEQALHHDPGNVSAMETQRDCFAALGDTDRAAETSMRIARTFADQQDLKRALDTCRDGLALSPDSIPLRYHYAQLLARTDNAAFAQSELRDIIEATSSAKKSLRTRRARELLISCHTLLLRIDPEDETAQASIRDLQNQSADKRRKRRLLVRAGIGAAALLLVLGLGISFSSPSSADLMEDAMEMRAAGNAAGMREILTRLTIEYPESDEATAANGILKSFNRGAEQKSRKAREKREAETREEYTTLLKQLQKQLATGDLDEAATELTFFIRRMSERRAAFLRPELSPTLKLEVEQFIERARQVFAEDRGFVASCERQLMQEEGALLRKIADTEQRLAAVRGRNWAGLSKQLAGRLGEALTSGMLKGIEKPVEKFRKSISTAGSAISGLDALYFRVRGLRLQEQIRDAVQDTRDEGRDLLAKCEFDGALKYYRIAYEKADSAAHEQPRKYFRRLNKWIADRDLLEYLGKNIHDIEEIVRSLQELDSLIAAKREDAGFRLLRELIREHRLVQFERRYRLPYKVTSEPPGARVLVDGEQVGLTPCAVQFDVRKGIDVRVEADGFEPVEARLEITNPKLNGRLATTLQKIKRWEHLLRGSPEASPVVHRGLVLVPTNEASLLALRTADGTTAWEAKSNLLDRIKITPLVHEDHVTFATAGGDLFHVRVSDGKIVGRLKLPGEVHRNAVMIDGVAYFATHNRKLVAVRGNKIVYTRDLAFVPLTRLVSVGDHLVVGTTGGELLVHNRKNGKEHGRLAAPERSSFFGGIATLGNLVAAAAEDGSLHAFDPVSKKRAWRYRLGGQLASTPISNDGLFFLPMRNGFVQELDAKGVPQKRLDFRNSMACPPVFHAGFVYVAAGSRLVAYDFAGRRGWWEVAYDEEDPQHIAVGDGLIVTVTNRGRVYAYPADKR